MSAVFRLTIATPMSLGWYKPEVLDKRFYIRPPSVKGLWRWWARAFVAGVMYEMGCLAGRSGKGELLVPTSREAEAVSRVVGTVMGLGYAGEKAAMASKFALDVRVLREPSIGDTKGRVWVRGRWADVHRFAYLTRKTPPIKYAVGGDFELEVSGGGPPQALEVLLVALTLEGLGKGGRKGLGSIDVTAVYRFRLAHDLKQLVEDVRRWLRRWISPCSGKRPPFPPMPAVAEGVAEIYRVEGLNFSHLHDFFLRSHRARVLKGNYAIPDELRERLLAWVLGLPRKEEKTETGYGIMGDVKRRASTFIVSFHNNHVTGKGGYLTVIRSADWPTALEWTGGGYQQINIDFEKVSEAYDTALSEFREYVEKLGGSMSRLWP
jgi:CRISPR-associated protein Cmr1